MNVSQRLGKWYDINKRNLPWREHLNPYHIWVSEIILQQTRMNQGMDYYLKFIEKFPGINVLAASSIEDVLILWQGLGYYTRARNLHKTAKIIVEKYNGIFPSEYESIRKLPGIGDYTAAAISSLGFNLPYPAIDGNVYRVLARFFGIFSPINSTKVKSDFYKAALEIIDQKQPGKHNQAMIELGALICLPRNPKCTECPISETCYAFTKNCVQELPVRQKKLKVTNRYFYYLVIHHKKKLYIKQRKQKDIWALLYEFPMIEMPHAVEPSELTESNDWKEIFMTTIHSVKKISNEYVHKLSHQTIHAWFIEIEVDKPIKILLAIQIEKENMNRFPLPRLIEKYLQ